MKMLKKPLVNALSTALLMPLPALVMQECLKKLS